ncbi:AAA domain-containing protein [Loktanella atrilutea]|uniref:AAA domain-containing protein n=1 Tax=Loktanella atrilutea TaxID=366533 RepID=A0A1M5EP65_LOKAT|nr:ATP-binding protein [Loktanella atrilutea]SHF80944.1 AAA domain-containing protein [Loktanella atrilutea]
MSIEIVDLTLDEVVQHLAAGNALQVSDGVDFSLPMQDSRNLLVFYDQNRKAYWNPEKDTSILDGEIDRLLEALDRPAHAIAPATRPTGQQQRWKLVGITAHRFRGLHRHCDDRGGDPKPFTLELSQQANLFRGFNGAGKTSMISAICWCLTGYGHRSQGLPSPLHVPITVQIKNGNSSAEPNATFELPPIVPIPTEKELLAVDGLPRVDTWVRLKFRSLVNNSEVEVERRLERDGKKNFKTTAVGLAKLGLPELALQVGTLMPGVAAATRFDDKTTLSQAISTLTGLRPLAHFGSRSIRLHDRLTGKYPKLATEEKERCEGDAAKQVTTLWDLLKEGEGLPDLSCVSAPKETAPDNWKDGLKQAEDLLRAAEDQAAADARLVLGKLPQLTNDSEIRRFDGAIKAAESCFGNAALKGLPSMQLAHRLGEMSDDDLSNAETVMRDIEQEAATLVEHLSHAERADRVRLYGLVAKWHDTAHPGHAFTACPVCERDLLKPGAIPIDAMLDKSVAQALEEARKADTTMLKTAAEWERDMKKGLRDQLPEMLRRFVDDDVPDDLASVYGAALSKEVFQLAEFPELLKPMAKGVAALCTSAWRDAPDREPLPGVNLPVEIPDEEKLRAAIRRIRRAISLSRYRATNADFVRSAVVKVLRAELNEIAVPANDRSIQGQLSVLKAYLDAATVFAGIRRQLSQIQETCERWAKARTRLEKLARAAEAVEPFKDFPDLVHNQVAGLISNLQEKATLWSQRMYRAHFVQAPEYAGLDSAKSDGFTFLAAQGKHLVEAHHVMNASALRAFLSAFVLALWQQVWSRSGGISTFLMDDPQDLLDPGNVANLAATVPSLMAEGINPLIVSNDFGFIPTVEAFVAADKRAAGLARTETWEFSAISTSKCTVSLAPVADEVRGRCEKWQNTDPNDTGLAREFVHPVRVRTEIKLWDLLASDPAVLHDPTMGDLLGKIANACNRGEKPFNEEPFRRLLELQPLKPGAPYRDVINKAHHGRADQITPAEAEIVNLGYNDVFSAIDACWLAYARFMGRLPPEEAVAEAQMAVPALTLVPLRTDTIPVVGRLAARAAGAPLTNIDQAEDHLDLLSLGDISLFALRAPTLGMIAFPGQTLIVSATAEVKNGDLAIVRTHSKTYARRIGLDKSDRSRIALESMPSTNPRVPQTHFIQRSSANLSKVIGVLFDESKATKSQDEAIETDCSPILRQVVAAARVVGDSAFPVALDAGHILLGPAPNLALLDGRILAIVTKADEFSGEYFAYLKRLGKPMPGSETIYYLENVGQAGEGEFIQFPVRGQPLSPRIPIVEQTWKVLGTLF